MCFMMSQYEIISTSTKSLVHKTFFFFFFFFMATPGVWKFLGQGLNLSCRCDLPHSCGCTESFNPLCHSRNSMVLKALTHVVEIPLFRAIPHFLLPHIPQEVQKS